MPVSYTHRDRPYGFKLPVVEEGFDEGGGAGHLGRPQVVVGAQDPGPVPGPEVGRAPAVLLRVVVQHRGVRERAGSDVQVVELLGPVQQRAVVGQARSARALRAVLGEDRDQAVPVGSVHAAFGRGQDSHRPGLRLDRGEGGVARHPSLGHGRVTDPVRKLRPPQSAPTGSGALARDRVHHVCGVQTRDDLAPAAHEHAPPVLDEGHPRRPELVLVHGVQHPGRVGQCRRHEPRQPVIAGQVPQPVGFPSHGEGPPCSRQNSC